MKRLSQDDITKIMKDFSYYIYNNIALDGKITDNNSTVLQRIKNMSQIEDYYLTIKAYDILLNSKNKDIDTRKIHKEGTNFLTQKLKETKNVQECSKQTCDGNKFYSSTVLSWLSKVESKNANQDPKQLKALVIKVMKLVQRLIIFQLSTDGPLVVKYNNDIVGPNKIFKNIPKIQVFKNLSELLQEILPKKYLDDLQNKIELLFNLNNSSEQDLTFQQVENIISIKYLNYQNESISAQSGMTQPGSQTQTFVHQSQDEPINNDYSTVQIQSQPLNKATDNQPIFQHNHQTEQFDQLQFDRDEVYETHKKVCVNSQSDNIAAVPATIYPDFEFDINVLMIMFHFSELD
ncbi:Hypothetical_protein [Hexamita inflata]|uniref:Hypothetical_protein n=1 Tax=Hexamita inflata TaxID=28002 RepID=A0AA86RED8_9EUKA|nr:Hypothetical protein HINF_LOCUS62562 [Hexamita inflata]